MERDELIRQRAYELWEAGGRSHGRDGYYWAFAKQQIDAEQAVLDGKVEEDADLRAAEARRRKAKSEAA